MLDPKSLRQVLEVLRDARSYYSGGDSLERGIQMAIRQIAKAYNVRYQTIGDGCRRRLGLQDISEFRKLVKDWIDGDGRGLIDVLKRHTNQGNLKIIEGFFQESQKEIRESVARPIKPSTFEDSRLTVFSFRLPNEEAKNLRALAALEEKTIPEWIAGLVSDALKSLLKNWATDFIKKEGAFS
jgi:hypothetical protein